MKPCSYTLALSREPPGVNYLALRAFGTPGSEVIFRRASPAGFQLPRLSVKVFAAYSSSSTPLQKSLASLYTRAAGDVKSIRTAANG